MGFEKSSMNKNGMCYCACENQKEHNFSHLVSKQTTFAFQYQSKSTFDRLKFIKKNRLKPVKYNMTGYFENQTMLYFKTSSKLVYLKLNVLEL